MTALAGRPLNCIDRTWAFYKFEHAICDIDQVCFQSEHEGTCAPIRISPLVIFPSSLFDQLSLRGEETKCLAIKFEYALKSTGMHRVMWHYRWWRKSWLLPLVEAEPTSMSAFWRILSVLCSWVCEISTIHFSLDCAAFPLSFYIFLVQTLMSKLWASWGIEIPLWFVFVVMLAV